MTDASQATTWTMPRESVEWVGPIDITVRLNGETALVPDSVRFAVLPRGIRPAEDDWTQAVADPAGTGGIGVREPHRPGYIQLGIWARIPGVDEDVVLEPAEVGWITRT